ncbi:MAG: hypothetical protein OEW84_06570 [Aigarchaeota archaeon]|nr:hypothetical protein [Aigarchaeota archaeon]MDH5795158.1 hypothetical protein [Candidatus Bathyarchaeota archaeon]
MRRKTSPPGLWHYEVKRSRGGKHYVYMWRFEKGRKRRYPIYDLSLEDLDWVKRHAERMIAHMEMRIENLRVLLQQAEDARRRFSHP